MSTKLHFAGIPFVLHWSLLATLAAEILIGVFAPNHLLIIPCLFILVSAHELGHLLVCRACGLEAREIVIYPAWGIFYFTLSPRPLRNILVLLGGIAAQILLFAIFLGFGILFIEPGTVLPKQIEDIFSVFIPGNVMIMIVNLLPFRGSDGWHLSQQIRQLRKGI